MTEAKQRFDYIDRFRGFIGVLMLLGHCSYYLNSVWIQLDPLDPLFPSWGQFALRFMGYICAPGFLMMAGAMVWFAYHKRVKKGFSKGAAMWYFIKRGIFLILIQMTWVNSSWGGFSRIDLWHIGIIASIGISMILLVFLINLKWYLRLIAGLLIFAIHPLLISIPVQDEAVWQSILMETFVTAGKFNKYPVLPWFALAALGSVMANLWFSIWKNDRQRIFYGILIAVSSIGVAFFVRLFRGYGNIFPYSDFGSISFFVDQKYPPSLFHNLFFFGIVVLGVTLFIFLQQKVPKLTQFLSIPGKVPLFFYAVHLAILGVFVKRMDFFYLKGGIAATFIGFLIMLLIMLPLSKWFYGVKQRSKNKIIAMI